MNTTPLVIEGFAGPGGWSTGLRMAGFTGRAIGIEHDRAACLTAVAAGHQRIQADVATFPLGHLTGKVDGLIMSPPCQSWSAAGDQKGKEDQPLVFERIAEFAAGTVPPERAWADERSKLTAEPMRWAVALRPQWIALEQVPAVLPLWEFTADLLRRQGYRVWTGILGAEEYGVPQTRRRAILIGRRDGLPAGRPEPTHQPYRSGREPLTEPDLFGDPLPPPVSMATALGWGVDGRPAWTVTGGGTESGGGAEVFAYAEARQQIAASVVRTGNNSQIGKGLTKDYERATAAPAPTLTGNVNRWQVGQARNSGPGAEREPRPIDAPSYTIRANGSGSHPSGTEWVLRSNYGTGCDPANRGERSPDEPAATVTSKAGQNKWVLRNGRQENAADRDLDEPAATVYSSRSGNLNWVLRNGNQANACERDACERDACEPAGTLFFGARTNAVDFVGPEGSHRVTVQEAGILQSFPADYPWQGTKSQQYRCVGDAVPPLLAAAILRRLLTGTKECAA